MPASREGAKALEAQVDAPGVAVKIEDHRPPGRRQTSPREQALPVLGLQTKDLGLEPERRRIDLAGVARKQDPALAGVKSNHDETVERDEGNDRDQHLAPSPASAGVEPQCWSAFTIASVIFLASPNSISVLSRKKSSFSTPA